MCSLSEEAQKASKILLLCRSEEFYRVFLFSLTAGKISSKPRIRIRTEGISRLHLQGALEKRHRHRLIQRRPTAPLCCRSRCCRFRRIPSRSLLRSRVWSMGPGKVGRRRTGTRQWQGGFQ